MKKWEYKQLWTNDFEEMPTDDLNGFGKEGWRLIKTILCSISIDKGHRDAENPVVVIQNQFIFERELKPTPEQLSSDFVENMSERDLGNL